jgi:hypothetical protein
VFKASTTPITIMPERDAFTEVLEKFKNPPVSKMEKAPTTQEPERAR